MPTFEFKFRPVRVKIVALHEGQVVTKKTVWPVYKTVYSPTPTCPDEQCALEHLDL
ncbi:hypothetical protein AKJ08_1167 [Vulgatibacter incomptus]|uniref:Uncharacterized protein n=1 Tax=Vulgatibacter incomptus TaxID=1391653 RepID=A0A0K1PB84_9BACT|nr:hypothetical protein AKJ08_1167 [Vulgatibacter incomptus]